jgi:hypothetical protein
LFKIVEASKNLFSIIILVAFFVFQIVSKGRFKLYKGIAFKPGFSKDNLVVIGVKLVSIVFKVGLVLGKESLEGFFISLIGAGLVYLISLGLLNQVEEINLLLEGYNLSFYALGIVVILANIQGSKNLKYHYIFILLSQLII